MKKNMVISGVAALSAAAILFWAVSMQTPTQDCLVNCGFLETGELHLTSLLPLMLGTLGVWLVGVGIRRK